MQDPAATELRLPQASVEALRAAVEEAQRDRASLDRHANAVREVIYRLDQGTLRVAEKGSTGWMIQDGTFIGSRCIVVEGVLVEEEAVLGAGVVLTSSTPIHDVTGAKEKVIKGMIPARSVVIPGMRPRSFPAGEYLTPCALIIGTRTQSTDRKTSLNSALRDFGVPV